MMKKNAKKIISAMLILMLALQVLPSSAFITKASETTESKEPIYTDAGLMYVYYNDISTYRTDKSYPEEEGYVFGGWWTNVTEAEKDANAEPLSESDDSGSAWAKYVPEDVLTVKAQISQRVADATTNMDTDGETLAAGNSLKLRLVTSVDNRTKYSEIGFKVKINSEKPCKAHIYEELTVREKNTTDKVQPEDVFHKASSQFATFVIGGFNTLTEINNTELCVTPYWKTLDGTTVYGSPRTRLLASDDRASDADGSKTGEADDFAAPENAESQIGTYTYNVTSVSDTTSYKYFKGASDTVYLKGKYTPNGSDMKFGIAIRNGGQTRQVLFSNAGVLVTNGVDGESVATSGLASGEAADVYDDVTYTASGVYVWAQKATSSTANNVTTYAADTSAIKTMLAGTEAKTVIWAIEDNVLYCSVAGEIVLRLPMELLCEQWQDGRYYQLGVAAYNAEENTTETSMSYEVETLTCGKDVYRKNQLIQEEVSMSEVKKMVYEPITGSYIAASQVQAAYCYGTATNETQVLKTTIKLPFVSGTSSNGISVRYYDASAEKYKSVQVLSSGKAPRIMTNHTWVDSNIKTWTGVPFTDTDFSADVTAVVKEDTLYILFNNELVGSVDLYKILPGYTEGTRVQLGISAYDTYLSQALFSDVTVKVGAEAVDGLLAEKLNNNYKWEIFTNDSGIMINNASDIMSGTSMKGVLTHTEEGNTVTCTPTATTATNGAEAYIYGVATSMSQKLTATVTQPSGSYNGISVALGNSNSNSVRFTIKGGQKKITIYNYGSLKNDNTDVHSVFIDLPGEVDITSPYNVTAIIRNETLYVQYNNVTACSISLDKLFPEYQDGDSIKLGVYTMKAVSSTSKFENVSFEAGASVDDYNMSESATKIEYLVKKVNDGLSAQISNNVLSKINTNSGNGFAFFKGGSTTWEVSGTITRTDTVSGKRLSPGFVIQNLTGTARRLIVSASGNGIDLQGSADCASSYGASPLTGSYVLSSPSNATAMFSSSWAGANETSNTVAFKAIISNDILYVWLGNDEASLEPAWRVPLTEQIVCNEKTFKGYSAGTSYTFGMRINNEANGIDSNISNLSVKLKDIDTAAVEAFETAYQQTRTEN